MALLIAAGAPPVKKYSEKHGVDQAEKGSFALAILLSVARSEKNFLAAVCGILLD
jgi:hypothetical protein